MHSNFDAARAKIHPGTGKWFIEGEEFGLWLANRQDLLWLTGIRKFSDIMCRTTVMNVRNANPMLAGCGKTVLSYVHQYRAHGVGYSDWAI
jgi:hypothetical protein